MSTSPVSNLFQALQSNPASKVQQSVKPGQMISGKVLKLYPQQKALIQLGSREMTAQLEASLELNGRYVFQVKANDPVLTLQVMQEAVTNNIDQVASMLKQLGFSANKQRIDLVQQLYKNNVPFTEQNLKEAFAIMAQAKGGKLAQQVLLHMMKHSMPIRLPVWQALHSRMGTETSFLSTLQIMKQELPLTSSSSPKALQAVHHSMQRMMNKSVSESVHSVIANLVDAEMHSKHQPTMALLQKAGLLSGAVTLRDALTQQTISGISHRLEGLLNNPSTLHQREWGAVNGKQTNSFISEGVKQLVALKSRQEGNLGAIPHPHLSSEQVIKNKLHSIYQQQLPVSQGMKQQLSHWVNSLQQFTTSMKGSKENAIPSTDQQWKAFLQQTSSLFHSSNGEKLLQVLQRYMHQHSWNSLKTLVDAAVLPAVGTSKQEAIPAALQTSLSDITANQLTKEEQHSLIRLLSVYNQGSQNQYGIRDSFYIQWKSALEASGMNYEHNLFKSFQDNESITVDHTLKGAILKGMQENISSALLDKMQNVLHQLNGIPLQVQDTEQTMQLQLHLPGEWFGMEQNLFMDMEGKKNENGDIDPDYCRILFYLELAALKETVIDMRVQKRIVQVTIYSVNEAAADVIPALKPALESGLEKIGYQLSTVRFKLPDEQGTNGKKTSAVRSYYEGGFDLKI
ncbi:hypothetical protein ACFFGV_11165 [Pontibacillus salicampi]|uniref:Flagellar hook-length control protein FliK n=1 Tax=Pontibacillus salicampi TaxID=1449801 RepID=A0ABV6LP12_9BACI